MSNIGIANLSLKNKNTNNGRVKGTTKELEIIKPTTTGSFPPTKFTTNGEPKPVDIPDNKNTDSFTSSVSGKKPINCITVINAYSPQGIAISLNIVRTIRCVGLAKTL